ncbi:MAG: AAA family ATPase [Sphingobacterium sp.]|jgi:predicted ATPase|nr:AAA family ATPase [Sphingobacterium sp.]
MINISSITAVVYDSNKRKYGFEYGFQAGLNIISGDNSSGKSTVLSCIYYCLGMEQLASYGNSDGLKECLKNSFMYNEQSIPVIESYAELKLKNDKNDVALIRRFIKSEYGETSQNLQVKVNDGEMENKFIHRKGDSDHESGFYRWLSDFSGISIPVFESEDGIQKILYLQQIFASSFVEQTKGWSDFFAQVPIFNTKKAKQKIVEFTLGLTGLIEEFELDRLKDDEKKEKGLWENSVNNFKALIAFNNLSTPNLSESFKAEFTPKKIESLTMQTKVEPGKYLSIENSILFLEESLSNIKQANDIILNIERDDTLLENQKKTRLALKLLNEEFIIMQKEKNNEEIKIKKYEATLEQIKREIEVLSGLQQLNQLSSLHIGAVESCPVCNSSLLIESSKSLHNIDKVNASGSLSFFKSERSLYESYLKSSKNLMERFDKTLLYYQEKLTDLRYELSLIDKELISDARIPSKTAINKEMTVSFELAKLAKFQQQFNKFKAHLKDLSEKLANIKKRKDELNTHKKKDEELIYAFDKSFSWYLKAFGYSKELLLRIYISKDDLNKLFPVVSTPSFGAQPIRLMSSASDFIRAQWAFYIALLRNAQHHLGILVLDEPGQHAMATKDLKVLIKESAKIKDRQVIIAISKEDRIKNVNVGDSKIVVEKEVDLIAMLNETGLQEGKDYKLNMIEANDRDDKCIQLFD